MLANNREALRSQTGFGRTQKVKLHGFANNSFTLEITANASAT